MELILLFIAHFLGDFYFQTKKLAEKKEKSRKWMLFHCGIYLLPFIPLLLLSDDIVFMVLSVFVIFVSHYVVDRFKAYATNKLKNQRYYALLFFLDQCLHICVIFGVWFFMKKGSFNFIPSDMEVYLYTLLCVIICLRPSSVTVRLMLMFTAVSKKENESVIQSDEALTNGNGSIIGQIERIISLLLGFSGLYSLIGLVLTAKSIARFEQFKDKVFAENYLVGTLTSLLIVIVLIYFKSVFYG